MRQQARQQSMFRQCQTRRRSAAITVFGLGLVIAVVLMAFLAFGEDKQDTTLQLVSVIFRHGDRTPTETYRTDPHRGSDVWQDGWGALTKKGKLQMFELGQYLRSHYEGFISDLYSPQQVYMLSSANDRCLMSAETLLSGLYPPKGHQVWNPLLMWQPIPVHSLPRNLDKMIAMRKPCPKYEQEYNKALKSTKISRLNEEHSDLYRHLSQHTGESVNTISSLELLYNTLDIEKQNGLELPQWTQSISFETMKHLASESLAVFTQTQIMKRLKSGPLVGEIAQHMSDKSSGALNPDRKLFLYAAHDVTIVSMWQAFGFTDLLKPEYGAMLLVELHKSSLIDFEVKLFYRNNTAMTVPTKLVVPGCGEPCLLDTFFELMKPIVPLDWEAECQLTS